jgi:hypothetical protein
MPTPSLPHKIVKHPLPLLLAAIILILHLPVIFSPVNYLLTWFNTDDAFYYFVPARNIAAGNGFTFDGIARTNGFHPLWMFILVPIFAIPDLILPLRVLAGLLTLLNIGTAWLLFGLVRRYFSSGVAFITALAFSLLPILHNETTKGGVEAGLNVFLIVLLLNRLVETDIQNLRGVLLTSGIAALTFLARLDNVFLTGLSGAWLLIENWNPAPSMVNVWHTRLRLGIAYFLPLGLVVLAYITWNQIGFGTLTPVSGQVKRWWGTLPNSVYGFPPKRLSNYIGQFVTDDQSIGPWAILTGPFYRTAEGLVALIGQEPTVDARRLALAGLGVVVLGLLGWLGWRNQAWVWASVRGLGLIPLLGGCLMQIAYYKIGGSVAQRTWYWVAEMLWIVLVSGMVAEMVWKTSESTLPNKKFVLRSAYFVTMVLALGLIWPHVLRIPRIFSVETVSREAFYLRRANWLEANTEPGALIGMTGSGSSGYFTEGRTIVNLDGLIGSVEYFEAMQTGTADDYLTGIGLDYVFGNAYIVQESDPYGEIFEGRLEETVAYEDGERVLLLWRFIIRP